VEATNRLLCLLKIKKVGRLISYYSLYAPEKSDNLRVRDQKKHVPYTRIWEPDTEDEKKRAYKKSPTLKQKTTLHAGFWVNKSENYLEVLPTSSQSS